MTKFYNVVRKDSYEKNGEQKTSWKPVGMTLIEKDGKMYLIDDRTGCKYYLFEKEQNRNTATQQTKQSDDFDDQTIPF
jgi:hypothetical protein